MKKQKKSLIQLILFLFAITTAKSQDLNLKIMSFNIQQPFGTNWDNRKSNVASIFNVTQADVIGTQEAVNYQRDYIAQQTGYAWYGIARDGGDNGEGSWIFYKADKYSLDSSNSGSFWMSTTPNIPSRFEGDYNRICTYVHLIEKSSGKSFYIFNSHFPTPDLPNARLKSAKLLTEKIANRAIKTDPVYVTGDFNSTEGDAVTIWMKNGSDNAIKFRDTYRDVYPTGNVNTGFGTKFDYIYCPTDSKYTSLTSWVITNPVASDHYPIAATVRYNNSTTPPIPVTQVIPGKIEAENYSNSFGIQLENTTDIGQGQNVGYLDLNDWLEYKVDVASASKYTFDLRYASNSESGKINVLIDGVYYQSTDLPITNGWQTWQTITKNIDLPAGLHTIKIEVVKGGFNLNWFNFSSQTTSGLSIPGKIEAENYSMTFGTQLENTTDTGGGQNVGYFDVNDILEYNVTVSNTGNYNFDIRIASLEKSGRLNLLVDNNYQKSIDLPITGGWQNWQTSSTTVNLTQGNHKLKFEIVKDGFNLNWFNFSNNVTSKTSSSKNIVMEESDSNTFYPNPAKDFIYFNNEYDWIVYSNAGSKVLSGRSQLVNVSSLNSGIYIVEFNGKRKKLLIN
ncbi:carbohydrate-binding protein [Flavobacterium sp. Fl-77]|uniref:Carbohydrate-binding protein n=1 Tax=Flavobacterium flavipigmentatum TaxID=2893884 RepID=A0AAJ2W1D3_9FLAO|nr:MULTISPECIES: carbohydrate-binding protein [unclassified Flavobacterium]MDX6182736.1 carbohydrate-binding protein [Flavobacterium sp. Fl-33]MDX6186085.1 carbohydrate-binding protein [Flavobacterium sp. Fl-77]UFH38234.1 carbohydrate-binding protein [Flavobacterium sp. F-70]